MSARFVLLDADKAMKILEARDNLKIHTIDFGSTEWNKWREIMCRPAQDKYLEIGGKNAPKILDIVKQYK
jgi:hypothetical protein